MLTRQHRGKPHPLQDIESTRTHKPETVMAKHNMQMDWRKQTHMTQMISPPFAVVPWLQQVRVTAMTQRVAQSMPTSPTIVKSPMRPPSWSFLHGGNGNRLILHQPCPHARSSKQPLNLYHPIDQHGGRRQAAKQQSTTRSYTYRSFYQIEGKHLSW